MRGGRGHGETSDRKKLERGPMATGFVASDEGFGGAGGGAEGAVGGADGDAKGGGGRQDLSGGKELAAAPGPVGEEMVGGAGECE